MTGVDITALSRELERRSAMTVTFHDWDPFILGEVDVLEPESIRAGDLARKEASRWQRGRTCNTDTKK